MRRESKVKRIFEAFVSEPDLDGEVVEQRRLICASCPFNSKNFPKDEMNLMQKIQHETGNFCTVCSCYIDKKTARSGESCGLEEKGDLPKWSRLILRTVENEDLNVENLTYELCNVKIGEDLKGFVIEPVVKQDKYLFKLKLDKPITAVVSSCQCIGVDTGDYTLDISFDTTNLGETYNKSLDVFFRNGNEELGVTFSIVNQ